MVSCNSLPLLTVVFDSFSSILITSGAVARVLLKSFSTSKNYTKALHGLSANDCTSPPAKKIIVGRMSSSVVDGKFFPCLSHYWELDKRGSVYCFAFILNFQRQACIMQSNSCFTDKELPLPLPQNTFCAFSTV